MLVVFWDASALVKRYVPEPGVELVNEAFLRLPGSGMACSQMGILEVVSIFIRKRNDGRLTPALFEEAMKAFAAEIIKRVWGRYATSAPC